MVLVNDLDLSLVGPDGRHSIGNNWTFAGDAGPYLLPDRLNPHEQARPPPNHHHPTPHTHGQTRTHAHALRHTGPPSLTCAAARAARARA